MKYRLQLATHWQFHPRDVDELTLDEFDHFALQADAIERHEDEERRKLRAQQARTGR
jgi:hypothetical protein